ncbi:hypothetical protein V6W80_09935 [Pseudomonas benzopyrenica]|uniref:Uncharacterized protein n=1 Tax=Pseudomonas benzopyrenica TaxID=2993566 RepID=A0ABZ2FUQ1_9PSED
MRVLAAAAIFAFSVGAASAASIQDKTDRFTGVRSVSYSALPKKDGYTVSLAAYYGKDDRTPTYVMEILTWSNEWRYLDCNSDAWLLDGNREESLEAKYDHSMAGGATVERFVYRPSRETLEKLASAKVAEYKVCNDEQVVSKADMAGIRQVLDATK